MISLDRRIIFLLIALAIAVPIVMKFVLPPSRMVSAEKVFGIIESLPKEEGGIAFVVLDYGPNTQAENLPQSEVTIEHLMRRRIPFAMFSQVVIGEPFLNLVPEKIAKKLMAEMPEEKWEYGRDWVNLGFRPGGFALIQAVPKAQDLIELFKRDAQGNSLKDLPAFKNVKTFKDIKILAQFTGLVGTLGTFIQFFQSETHRPIFIHGCTSITVPEAYIFVDSGQLSGLFEGMAGAAWYSKLLSDKFLARKVDSSLLMNTGLGVAQFVMILLIILGNLGDIFFKSKKRSSV